MIRLDKFFTELGIKSRSEIKEEIKKGLVKVNGVQVKKPETKLDETKDVVEYKGEKLSFEKYVYYILNKPAGFVCARTDKNDKTVMDLICDKRGDLSPVGRLDKDTTGLLIITNDGELNHKLMSPKTHVEKTYFARIEGEIYKNVEELFEKGIDIGDEKPCKPAKIKVMEHDDNLCYFTGEQKDKTFAEITITEGRYHQVKRMVAAVGGKVTDLKRVAIGAMTLPSDLLEGEYKKVTLEYLNEHIFCTHGGNNGI